MVRTHIDVPLRIANGCLNDYDHCVFSMEHRLTFRLVAKHLQANRQIFGVLVTLEVAWNDPPKLGHWAHDVATLFAIGRRR